VIRKPNLKPEGYIENPAYNSIAVRKSIERMQSRLNAGLMSSFVDIKDSSNDPKLSYI
jgi:hypothetical protein